MPEIFNIDQGCQFTSEAFTGVLLKKGIAISMDERGRALDNIFVKRLWRSVKHEDVYLKGYATMSDLLIELAKYFVLYNTERPHQSLGYDTPDHVYRTASGGGARIVGKYSETEKTHSEIETKKETENRGSDIPLHVKKVTLLNSMHCCLDGGVHCEGRWECVMDMEYQPWFLPRHRCCH